MKKRFIAVSLVIAMAMTSLLACSSKNDAETASSDTKAKKEETKKEPTKVILNEVAHSIFYAPMYVAIEEGYFADEGIDLDLVTGFGADKTMTAVLSGSADIGFMGSEASIYTYNEGANDYVVNFAQLTQRAGNFLVAREEMPDFTWEDIKGKDVLGGRKGLLCGAAAHLDGCRRGDGCRYPALCLASSFCAGNGGIARNNSAQASRRDKAIQNRLFLKTQFFFHPNQDGRKDSAGASGGRGAYLSHGSVCLAAGQRIGHDPIDECAADAIVLVIMLPCGHSCYVVSVRL